MSFFSDSDGQQPISPLQAASRFDALFDVYGLSLKQAAGPAQRAVTLIARSPASPAAIALATNLARFEPHSMNIGIIFAQIAPASALDYVLQSLQRATHDAPEVIIRWARNRALLDAHERLTLGCTLCWTGDAMRRSEDARGGIDRVDDANPAMLAEAGASFAALWKASKSIPLPLLLQAAEHAAPKPALLAGAFASQSSITSNIVSLETYLRSRRH